MCTVNQLYAVTIESIQSNLLADLVENILTILRSLLDLAVVRFDQVRGLFLIMPTITLSYDSQ